MFEDQVEKTKNLTLGILEPGPVLVTLFLVVVANAAWSVIGPALVAVLSALVQCGITTRLVLLGLFFAGSFGLFALRTVNQVWYGHLACVVALTTAWNMIARLAVRIDPTDVLALVGAAYVLVRGLANIQKGQVRPGGG